MKKIKKMVSAVTSLVMMMSAMSFSVADAAEIRDAYASWKVSSANDYRWNESQSMNFINETDKIGGSNPEYWMLYENMDFGTEEAWVNFNITVARPNDISADGGRIRVYTVEGVYDASDFSVSYEGVLTSQTATVTEIFDCKLDRNTNGGWDAGEIFSTDYKQLNLGVKDIVLTTGSRASNQIGDLFNFNFEQRNDAPVNAFDRRNFADFVYSSGDIPDNAYYDLTVGTKNYTDVDGQVKTGTYVGGTAVDKYVAYNDINFGEKGVSTINMALGNEGNYGNLYVYLMKKNVNPLRSGTTFNWFGDNKFNGLEPDAIITITPETSAGGWDKVKIYSADITGGKDYEGMYDMVVRFSGSGVSDLFYYYFAPTDFTQGAAPVLSETDSNTATATTYINPGEYRALYFGYNGSYSLGTTTAVIKNINGEAIATASVASNSATEFIVEFENALTITTGGEYTLEVSASESSCPSEVVLLRNSAIQNVDEFNFMNYYRTNKISGIYADHFGGTSDSSYIMYLVDFGDNKGLYDATVTYAVDGYTNNNKPHIYITADNKHMITYNVVPTGSWTTQGSLTQDIKEPMSGIKMLKLSFSNTGTADIYGLSFAKHDYRMVTTEENQKLKAEFQIDNTTEKYDAGIKFITATYNNGQLKNVTIGNPETDGNITSYKAPIKMDSGDTFKGFAWNMNNIKPVNASYAYTPKYLFTNQSAYENFYPGALYSWSNGMFNVNATTNVIGTTTINTVLRVPNIDFGTNEIVESFDVGYGTELTDVHIKYYLDEIKEANLLGEFTIGADDDLSGGWDNVKYKTVPVNYDNQFTEGLHDIIIVYGGENTINSACNLFDMKFNKAQ